MTEKGSKSEKDQQENEERKLGNDCLKDSNFAEAILHYTYAIKKEPKNHILYSNRSFAFLKLKDYYHALEDARTTIKFAPSWPKGYYRKGEVEFATEHYELAFNSYSDGMRVQKEDTGLMAAMKKAATARDTQRQSERRLPWVGIGIGWLIGMMIVAAHQLTATDRTLDYLAFKVLFSLVFAGLGYGVVTAFAYINKNQREAQLQPPYDLLADMNQSTRPQTTAATPTEADDNISSAGEKARRRSGPAGGRQRMKMGKS